MGVHLHHKCPGNTTDALKEPLAEMFLATSCEDIYISLARGERTSESGLCSKLAAQCEESQGRLVYRMVLDEPQKA